MNKIKLNYKTRQININNFSRFNLSSKSSGCDAECVNFYNLSAKQGVLTKSMGVKSLMVYESDDVNSLHYQMNYECLGLEHINKVMYFKQYFARSGDTTHRLLIHGSDGKLYLYEMFVGLVSPNWVYELQFDDIPAVLSYKKDGLDSILISAKDKLVVWSTGRTPYELTNIPTITSMCVHNDILYCTIAGESDRVWYTKNLDPESVGTESEDTGYLTLEGSAGGGKKMAMLDENIFVFCDYGIGRINTYAKSKPTYNQIYLSNGRIYPDTVVVSGDEAIFLTDDGLYRFNGTSVSKIDVLNNLLVNSQNSKSSATVLNDNYYLATNVKFNDTRLFGCEGENNINNALIKLNLNDNTFEIVRGIDIKSMLALKAGVEEKIILTFNGKYKNRIGELDYKKNSFFNDGPLTGGFATNYIVDQTNENIALRKITLDVSKGETVNIYTDKGKTSFYTNFDGINERQLLIPCKKFKVEVLLSNDNAYLNSVKVEYVKSKD